MNVLLFGCISHSWPAQERKIIVVFQSGNRDTISSSAYFLLVSRMTIVTTVMLSSVRVFVNYVIVYFHLIKVWTDHRLKWEESEYKNRSRLYLRISDIWTPSVTSEWYGTSDFLTCISFLFCYKQTIFSLTGMLGIPTTCQFFPPARWC